MLFARNFLSFFPKILWSALPQWIQRILGSAGIFFVAFCVAKLLVTLNTKKPFTSSESKQSPSMLTSLYLGVLAALLASVSCLQGPRQNHEVQCVLVFEYATGWPGLYLSIQTVRVRVLYHNCSMQEGRDVMSHKEFLDCASSADMKHNCQTKPFRSELNQIKHSHHIKCCNYLKQKARWWLTVWLSVSGAKNPALLLAD